MKRFFFERTSFKTQLAISYFLVGFVTLVIISAILYSFFKNAIIERTQDQLESINTLKKSAIEDLFKHIIITIQEDEIQLLFKPDDLPVHTKDSVLFLNENNQATKWRSLKIFSGYAILDDKGKILKKEFDENTSIQLINTPKKTIRLIEFIKHKSSFGIQILDLSKYVANQSSQLACVLEEKTAVGNRYYIFFINQNKINEIVEVRSGMGKTGESYLVSDNYEMRSRSRFLDNEKQGQILVKTPSVIKALQNIKGRDISYDYRGVDVISVYNKLSIPGVNWVIISEIDMSEAMAPVWKLKKFMFVIAISASIILVIVTLLLSRLISSPINVLNKAILNLSKGKLSFDLTINQSNDEIARMQEAVMILKDNLSSTTTFAEEIGNGNFKAAHQPLSEEDSLGYALLLMRDKLMHGKQLQAQLIRQRSGALIEGQEKERERISRELHDSLGQMLTAIRLRTGLIKDNETVKNDLKNIIDDTIAEVRRISNNVMPSILIDFGLESALRSLTGTSSRITEDISVSLSYINNVVADVELPYDIKVSLYRIAQEAINNGIKYSKSNVINIQVVQENSFIRMNILDNGVGFDTKVATVGKGLYNMRERARLIGGKCLIKSVPGEGTEIIVEIPLKQI
ncbi:MAG: sensor histidine kinase [Cytophagales bacterium]|nr:sensor histidine kinase [Cytophaga sp.]